MSRSRAVNEVLDDAVVLLGCVNDIMSPFGSNTPLRPSARVPNWEGPLSRYTPQKLSHDAGYVSSSCKLADSGLEYHVLLA